MEFNASVECEDWDDLVEKIFLHKDDIWMVFLWYEFSYDVSVHRLLRIALSNWSSYNRRIFHPDDNGLYALSSSIVLCTLYYNLSTKINKIC